MASSSDLVQYIADQCRDAGGIVCRKMFGDYGIYCDINNDFDDCISYDMHLKDNIFDSLEVRLSPSANDSHKIIVESFLKQYAPSATWKESELCGTVKLK